MPPSRQSVWQRSVLLTVIALATLWHARSFDFFCDDAFIALRYAKNLSQHGELAYNLGQRVEGFTSPLWVLLLSAAGSVGIPLVSAARALGGAATLLTFWALTSFWDELEPEAPWLVIVPALSVALSSPIAAWTFGGLETPLFVALFTLGLALVARAARRRELRSCLHAGIAVACCCLCRPEGVTLIGIGSVALGLTAYREPSWGWRRLLAWVLPSALLVGGYELFRLRYYGFPLPNTFYVKTSGDGLWQRGLSYLDFAASEFGWLLVSAYLLSFVYLSLGSRSARSGRVLAVCTSIASLIHLLYVARIGGDFLDLYRFLAPLLPAAACCLICAVFRLLLAIGGRVRFAIGVILPCLLLLDGVNQRAMADRARRVAESSRAALHLEPLGWTRLYAQRWAGLGRWLAQIRTAGDSTAIGAAGALPFYAELPNLDLFGLNDLEIAHRGRVIGNRPGHQRFATMDYLLAQQPTFIFLNPESTPPSPGRLRYDRYWTSRGYLPIEIRVPSELCECEQPFYHQFLVRRERAASLKGRADVAVGNDSPR